MTPLRLTVQGLYSYKETQVIDFETLAGSQLFGIFGAVGSGKSSILEAVVFALYDRSERLNKSGDNRYYNMLNLQSQQFAIDFVFQVTSPQPTKYRFTVSARRKKKDFEKVEVKERRQYRWENNHWHPIDAPDATAIIGMTYENFMQTVIIPQGKFREFIDQKPNDRTQMLKELFRLEKFDLSHKTSQLLAAVRTSITDLDARVSEIGPVSAETIDATRRKMTAIEGFLQENAAVLSEVEVACDDHEQLRKLVTERATAMKELQLRRREQPHYQAREKQLHEYQEAETHFKEKFRTLADAESERDRAEERYQGLCLRIETGRQKMKVAQQHCEQAQQNYADRDMIRAQCTDWEHMLRIRQVRHELQNFSSHELALRTTHEQQQKQCAALKSQIKKSEEQWGKTVAVRDQQTTLQAVVQWHVQCQQYEAERAEHQQNKLAQQRLLTQIEAQKDQALKALAGPASEPFDAIFKRLATARESLKTDLRTVIEKLANLRVRQELAHAARQLVSGQACPLCGATHHPSVAHAPEIDEETTRQEQVLSQLQTQEAHQAALETTLRKLHNDYQSIRGKQEGIQQLLDASEARLISHQSQFSWEAYRHHSPEALATELKECAQWLRAGQRLQHERSDQLVQLEQLEKSLAEAQQRWQQSQERCLTAKGKVENYRALLRAITYEDHEQLTEAQLMKKQEECRFQLQDTEQKYEAARQACQDYEKALGILEGKKISEESLRNTLRQQAIAIQTEITRLCHLKKFESVDYVQELINTNLDTQAEQSAVVAYQNRLHAAEENYEKLVKATHKRNYQVDEHRKAQDARTHHRQVREQLQQTWAVTKQEVENQREKLTKVQRLQQALGEQRLRESNLKELYGLFRGSGFVNYASTVLLQEVCRGANVRFKKLTKNNLSLELNRDNDFIVRDHLNDGRTRLLKTLSGGQTFQAALCLALALAENIQSLNQSQQSFFFLDEGFGSLDKNALRVVFDTLKTLRNENRIVGIISHVEELQQEIDVYLKIEHDRERGSLVKGSWE